MTSIRTSATAARFSRRALLKRLGASAAMLPLIHAERARAATAGGFPKRLITLAWTNGVAQPMFYPPGDDPTASEILKPFATANLTSKVLLPCGLDIKHMVDQQHTSDGHFSYPCLFTGTYKNLGGQKCTATGPSIDQFVSDAVAKQVNLPLPLMVAATGPSSPSRITSFRGDSLPNTGETDPARLYTRAFASAALPPDQIAALRARRKSVIDHVAQDLTAFGARLGTEDRAKIGAHLDSIRKLELELSAAPAKGCTAQAPEAAASYQTRIKAFCDLAAMAIRCDLTRVVSMTWGDDGGSGPGSFSFLGVTGDYHGIAHEGGAGYAKKVQIDVWLFQQMAYLAKALDDTPEAGGTALDHSVIVAANDMNEGAAHDIGGVPFVIVGSGGGYLKTGRILKFGTWAGKTGSYWRGRAGVSHNKLLATIVNAMDVPVESYGTGYTGTFPELRA